PSPRLNSLTPFEGERFWRAVSINSLTPFEGERFWGAVSYKLPRPFLRGEGGVRGFVRCALRTPNPSPELRSSSPLQKGRGLRGCLSFQTNWPGRRRQNERYLSGDVLKRRLIQSCAAACRRTLFITSLIP